MSKTTCSDATNNTDGSSSFGLDNTSFGIVTNSTSRRNRLEFSALGLCDNSENNTKTAAKGVKEVVSVPQMSMSKTSSTSSNATKQDDTQLHFLGTALIHPSATNVPKEEENDDHLPISAVDIFSHDVGILGQLMPSDVANITVTSKTLLSPIETWCKAVGLKQMVDCQLSSLTIYKNHPVGKEVSFNVYTKFLRALCNTPIENENVGFNLMKSWRCRYLVAARSRPRRFGALGNVSRGVDRFDWGYPGGYWCEAIDGTNQGKANDYFRSVGNGSCWALCAAGSDGCQYAPHWSETKPKPVEYSQKSYIQSTSDTEWDKNFTWWLQCVNVIKEK